MKNSDINPHMNSQDCININADIRNLFEERDRLKRELDILRRENLKLDCNIIILKRHLRRIASVIGKLGFKV